MSRTSLALQQQDQADQFDHYIGEVRRMEYLAKQQAKRREGMTSVLCPALTEEQQKVQDEYVRANQLPF